MIAKKDYYENQLISFPEFLSIKDVQSILKMSHRQVKELLENGGIPYFKSGSRFKIPKYELIIFLEHLY